MNDKDMLLTIVLLGGLALGGYWLIKNQQPTPPAPTPMPEPTPTGNTDVVNPPSPFGYSVGDPCKRFPSLCKFW